MGVQGDCKVVCTQCCWQTQKTTQRNTVVVRIDLQTQNNMSLSPQDAVERMQEREAMAKNLFMQYDENGDGVLDFAEMINMVKDLLPELDEDGEEAMRQEFRALDRDGDETIDFPEFVQYYNKMLSYQGGNTHSYDNGGSATDFWGSGDHSKHHRLLKKLHARKKLDDIEFARATYMLNSKYMILDLKVAFASWKRAETALPLKRLLLKFGPQIDQQCSLSEKFWSMTQIELQEARSKSDQWQAMGVITFDEYLQLRDLLERRVMMTEIKAVMDNDDTNLLKQVLRNATDQQQVELENSFNASSGNGTLSSYATNQSSSTTNKYGTGREAFLPPIDNVGLGDRNFELKYTPLEHQKRGEVMVPTLSHRTMTKREYLSFCTMVNMFMGDDENVAFSDDVRLKLVRVVEGLTAAGFLTPQLGNKAKEFIQNGDRFVIYAIYQYDSQPGALTSYLTYKQSEDDKIRKEVKGIRRNIARRNSMDAFMKERKEVLELARKTHADGILRHKEEKIAAKKEAAQEATDALIVSDETAAQRKEETHKPRWLLLYEAKFSSYNDLLYEKTPLSDTK